MPLRNVPPGTPIHNLELKKGRGGKIVRSAGTYAQILAKEGSYAHVKLPSGEIRLIGLDCLATIGQIGNIEHNTVSLGKGRPLKMAWQTAARKRGSHESCRSSNGRRRRKVFRRKTSVFAMGSTVKGIEDAQGKAVG